MNNENEKCQYDPNNCNAMFSQILEHQKSMDGKLDNILDQCKKTNGRVSSLETFRSWAQGSWWAVCLITAILCFIYHQQIRDHFCISETRIIEKITAHISK